MLLNKSTNFFIASATKIWITFRTIKFKAILHSLLNMREKELLTSVIEIKNKNWGNREFFEDM